MGWFSDSIRSLYAAQSPAQLSEAALAAVGRRFSLPIAALEELGHSGLDYTAHAVALRVPLPANHIAYLHDHPMLPRVSELQPIEHVRGIVPRAAFEQTDYFNCIARPMGYSDHLIIRVQAAPTAVTLSLCRDKWFTGGESALLALLQPHLAAAWKRLAAPHGPAASPVGSGIILNDDLKPIRIEPAHRGRFQSYFPGWREIDRLPAPLREWVAATRRVVERGLPFQAVRVFAVDSRRGRLLVRYFPIAHSRRTELKLIEVLSTFPDRHGVGLSPRECEVISWMTAGKRDGEIGIIMGVSARTVGKHVEHIISKLRVNSRTAAVNRYRQLKPGLAPENKP